MKQVELEKVTREKANLRRSGEKITTFLDSVTSDMVGAIVELKKVKGLWIVDKISEVDYETHQIKRNWSLGATQ